MFSWLRDLAAAGGASEALREPAGGAVEPPAPSGLGPEPARPLVILEPRAPIPAAPVATDPVSVYLAGLRSPSSQDTMRESLGRVARIVRRPMEAIAWQRLEYVHTSTIAAELVKRYRPATVLVTLAGLRGVLRTCWKMGLMTHEAFARATAWERIRATRLPAGRDLTDQEIEIVSAWCDQQVGLYGHFLRCTFALLLGGGLRASEVCYLPIDAYVPAERSVRLIRKGNKEQLVPLGADEAAAVEAWLQVRPKFARRVPWLLVRVAAKGTISSRDGAMGVKALEQLLLVVASKVAIRRFSPHDCRRTYCTRLLAGGLDLATVQRLMAHESPETTALYDRRQEAVDAEARRRVTIWKSSRGSVDDPK